MRKATLIRDATKPRSHPGQEWLDLEEIATVEVTSEDPSFPIELALAGEFPGWRAAEPGEQVIRIVLDNPRAVRLIRLEFSETDRERTQEFALRWSQSDGRLREIVRQQWNFSPQGSTSEIEEYQVQLEKVAVLELMLRPNLTPDSAVATLAAWRIA